MFGTTSTPFGSNLSELQNNYWTQIQAMQQMEAARKNETPILDLINKEVASLSQDEQSALASTQEYQAAKQTYEAGFMSFLGNKFSQEYVSSADGKVAAENLLNTIKKAKEKIAVELKTRQEKMNAMLSLLENDPDIKKKYDEMMINKQ